MASTINSTGTSSGLRTTADASGVLELQGGGNTGITISATGVVTFANSSGIPVAVEDLAALKALTSRPESVLVKTGQAAGVWQWVVGSTTTADDALVVTPTTGTAGRYKRVYDGPTYVDWYGADKTGVASSNAAITAMAAAQGYVWFGDGTYLIDADLTLADINVIFDAGAQVSISTTKTLTFTRCPVDGPRLQIFSGAGVVSFTNRCATVFPEWWGADPLYTTDSTAAFQAMMLSLAGTTESIVDCQGDSNYALASTIQCPRGTHIKGDSTRRTVFVDNLASGNVFETLDQACRFTNLQNESQTSGRAGNFIYSTHTNCVVEGIAGFGSKGIVELSGDRSEARNVLRFFENSTSIANFYTVKLAGTNQFAHNIKGSTLWGADSSGCVLLVEANGAAVHGNTANAIAGTSTGGTIGGPIIIVRSLAAASSIYGCQFSDIRTYDNGATEVVQIDNQSSSNISFQTFANVYGGSDSAQILVDIQNSGAGVTRDIQVNGLTGNSGALALNIAASAGSVYAVTINGLNARSLTAIYAASGDVTQVAINNTLLPDGNMRGTSGSYISGVTASVADDTAVSIVSPKNGGFIAITATGTTENGIAPNIARSGIAMYDVGTATFQGTKVGGGASFTVVSTDVSGTTGVDGSVTMGVIAGNIRIENRSGGAYLFRYTFFG